MIEETQPRTATLTEAETDDLINAVDSARRLNWSPEIAGRLNGLMRKLRRADTINLNHGD